MDNGNFVKPDRERHGSAPAVLMPGPVITEAASSEADVDQVKSANTKVQPGDIALMLADLPLEKRLHVQGLLADLDSKMDEQGLNDHRTGRAPVCHEQRGSRRAPTTRWPRSRN